MNDSYLTARLAGAALLGSLASIVATIYFFPSYDARAAYFTQHIPMFIEQRAEWATGLALLGLTGSFCVLTGIFLIMAYLKAGRSIPIPGFILVGSGMGFFLSAGLGSRALRIISEASGLNGGEMLAYASEAQPLASGSQAALLLIGIGMLALGLLAILLSMLHAKVFTRRLIMIAIAFPAILWVVLALVAQGAPLVWLVPGLPVAFWCVGLGIFLIATGRITSSVQN